MNTKTKPKRVPVLTVAEFKARIAAQCGPAPANKFLVRTPRDRGYYPKGARR